MFQETFTYKALPMRMHFGAGMLDSITDEVAELGLARVLVLCSPEQSALGGHVSQLLGQRSAGVFAEARAHVPVELAHEAAALAAASGADGCLAVGGGSAIGLGKAIALQHDLPVVAVPTTYAGSEMTPVWGLTENGRKRTGRDLRVLPVSVLYDPVLTTTLPVQVSVPSALNAIAHAVEALYAPDVSPVIALMAEDGTRSLAAALPAIAKDPSDLTARTEALYGAHLCGTCLGATTMSLHHKLAHVLGGALDLPHGPTHAALLPHVLAFNQPAAPKAVAALARAFGNPDPPIAVWELATGLGAPMALKDLGMSEGDIGTVAAQVMAHPYANPRSLTDRDLAALLDDAYHGRPPSRRDPSPRTPVS